MSGWGALLESLRAETPGCELKVHFDNAGASLMPTPVLQATVEHLQLEAQVGGYAAADTRAAAIDGFYTTTAQLLGCKPENVAFATSATDALCRAMSSIPFEAGDIILTTQDDYVSSQIAFLSLQRRFGVELVRAPTRPEGGVDVDAMGELMRSRRPRVVVVTHIPTNSGLVQPIAEIGARCRELDLLYVVDACQSAGQYPLDVEAIGCDFLSATGRKFLRGPRGSGFLYVSDRALGAGYEPLFLDMRGAQWTGPDRYEPVVTATRFEDWEVPYGGLLGLAEAIRYALSLGLDDIAKRTPALGARLRNGLEQINGVRVLDRGTERCAIVTFTAPGWRYDALSRALAECRIRASVSLREYALLDFAEKKVDWCIRLSPHYYNTEVEVDEVLASISEITRS